MDASLILKACTIYYNWVKYAQDSGLYDQLKKLSQKLAMERAIVDPNETNIDTDNGGLIATLKQEVDDMEEQDRFPITRPESKSAVNTLSNLVRQFDFHFKNPAPDVETQEQKRAKTNNMVSDFQKIVNEWNSYRTRYLNDDFLNEMQLAMGEADDTTKQEFDKRIRFWREFIQLTDSVIEQIEAMLKDQLTGNPETPLEPTPV